MRYDYILFLLFLFASCSFSSKDNREWKEYAELTINSWKGKAMILPDSLIVLERENFFQSICSKHTRSNFRIVTFIDIECSVCLNNFSYWEAFINDSKLKDLDCDFLIFVNVKKGDEMSIRNLNFSHPFIIDSTSQFIEKNQLWDKRFQTALINKKNEVIIIGDPTVNSELGKLYKNILSNPGKYQL